MGMEPKWSPFHQWGGPDRQFRTSTPLLSTDSKKKKRARCLRTMMTNPVAREERGDLGVEGEKEKVDDDEIGKRAFVQH